MRPTSIALAGMVAACALAFWVSRPKTDTAFRQFVIQSTLLRSERPIVILGDSIVEASTLPRTICGHTVVNAGIGGVTTTDNIEAMLVPPRPESRAALVVVALGINDANLSVPPARFRDTYRALIAKTAKQADRVAILGIAAPEAGFEKLHNVSSALVDDYNRLLPELAAATQAGFIAMPPMPERHTLDGVHLNGAGYAVWDAAVTNGITQLLCPANVPPRS